MEFWGLNLFQAYIKTMTGVILDYPNPRTVSLLKEHLLPRGGRAQGQLLKEDIINTLNFINNAKSYYKRMSGASTRLAATMSASSADELRSLHHRWREVGLLCQIQKVKRESLKYNPELRRTFQHGSVNDNNIKCKLVRPEHFERGVPSTKHKLKQHHANSSALAPLVNRNKGVVSPWDGSQFKYEILCSLYEKLLKKMILYGFRHYMRHSRAARQCIATCARTKPKKLLQLCFSSLLFDALSGKYIVFSADIRSNMYLIRKRAGPGLYRLQQLTVQAHIRRKTMNQVALKYQQQCRNRAYRVLLWNWRYNATMRVLRRWSVVHSNEHRMLTAFTAWVTAFITKNKLRRALLARMTHHQDVSDLASSVPNTPRNRADTLVTHTSPLRILEQTPLQNLRSAVSFFSEELTHPSTDMLHNSKRLKRGECEHKSMSVNFNVNVHDDDDDDDDDESGGANTRTLHVHTMSALKQLRSLLRSDNIVRKGLLRQSNGRTDRSQNNSSDNNVSYNEDISQHLFGKNITALNHSDDSISYSFTESPVSSHSASASASVSHMGAVSAMLSPLLRSTLRECLTAKKLLPQPHFLRHSPANSAPTPSHKVGLSPIFVSKDRDFKNNDYGCSKSKSGSEESLNEQDIGSNKNISEVWKRRHMRRYEETSSYLPGNRGDRDDPSAHKSAVGYVCFAEHTSCSLLLLIIVILFVTSLFIIYLLLYCNFYITHFFKSQ